MALGVGIGVEHGVDFQPGLGGDGADRSMTTSWDSTGRPRQVIVIAKNSLRSTLFHLLIPGRRCSTGISRSVSATKLARDALHSATGNGTKLPTSVFLSMVS